MPTWQSLGWIQKKQWLSALSALDWGKLSQSGSLLEPYSSYFDLFWSPLLFLFLLLVLFFMLQIFAHIHTQVYTGTFGSFTFHYFDHHCYCSRLVVIIVVRCYNYNLFIYAQLLIKQFSMAYGRHLYSRQVCSVVVCVNMLFRGQMLRQSTYKSWCAIIHWSPYPWQLRGLRFRATARNCLDVEAIVEKDSWVQTTPEPVGGS